MKIHALANKIPHVPLMMAESIIQKGTMESLQSIRGRKGQV